VAKDTASHGERHGKEPTDGQSAENNYLIKQSAAAGVSVRGKRGEANYFNTLCFIIHSTFTPRTKDNNNTSNK
jgi:hypothetical protein